MLGTVLKIILQPIKRLWIVSWWWLLGRPGDLWVPWCCTSSSHLSLCPHFLSSHYCLGNKRHKRPQNIVVSYVSVDLNKSKHTLIVQRSPKSLTRAFRTQKESVFHQKQLFFSKLRCCNSPRTRGWDSVHPLIPACGRENNLLRSLGVGTFNGRLQTISPLREVAAVRSWVDGGEQLPRPQLRVPGPHNSAIRIQSAVWRIGRQIDSVRFHIPSSCRGATSRDVV